MQTSLANQIGIGERELISIVGAGGKSTTLFTLSRDLTDPDTRIILTTTTMMAEHQVSEPTCWSDDPIEVMGLLEPGVPLFVVTGEVPEKATGPTPDAVDRLFLNTPVNFVIVEADGARSMSIKAPADHEPVIPRLSTTVIVVAAIDAIGRPISEVAHRPDLVANIVGVGADDTLSIDGAVTVLLSDEGGLKSIPKAARVVIALTKVTPNSEGSANELAAMLAEHRRIERVVMPMKTPSGQ